MREPIADEPQLLMQPPESVDESDPNLDVDEFGDQIPKISSLLDVYAL